MAIDPKTAEAIAPGEPAPGSARRHPGRVVWAVLGALLVLYVFSSLRIHPVATFGTSLDDALYFSSAKALAGGQGYILPSFPVRLRATRYPELYPLLLAGVWKIDPRFPTNIRVAVGLTLLFGCISLLFAFLILRNWPGLGDWSALGIAALCAFCGYFLYLSACVRTEIPFMAMLLASVWFAENRSRPDGSAFLAGLAAGLSVGLRSLGVCLIAGIGLAMLMKREHRRLLWFSVAALPLTFLSMWHTLTAMAQATRAPTHLANPGWEQTLCYYSSYACEWRVNTAGHGALRAIFFKNLTGIIQGPGIFLLDPLGTHGGLGSLILVSLLGVGAYVGIVRYVRQTGWQPLPIAFAFYLPVILVWPWTPGRFLLAFLPLLFGGLWLEARQLKTLVASHLRSDHPPAARVTAVLLGAGALALAGTVAANYAYSIPRQVGGIARDNARMLADKSGAYQWIRQHTGPDARVIAYDDGLLYLYTGRRSILPIVTPTQDFYQGKRALAERNAGHLADVACHVGATYWLVTTRDFDLTDTVATPILQQRQRQLLKGKQLVFQSADGSVRLYDIRLLTQERGKGCPLEPVTDTGPHGQPRLRPGA